MGDRLISMRTNTHPSSETRSHDHRVQVATDYAIIVDT